jgi:predicted alpha/beta superfamily hydrolase
MGYSLGGLFAVYAALETDVFDAAASVSGSMWYPGFAEYAVQKECALQCVYFSVGEREKLSRNAAFRSIEDCTHAVMHALENKGAKTVFELEPGGHFDDAPGRMRRALEWLNIQNEKRRKT